MTMSIVYADGDPMDEVDSYLSGSDPVMARLIRKLGPTALPKIDTPTDLFGALMMAIVRQQLAGPAAAAIYHRLLGYFGGSVPAPDVLLHSGSDLRATAGLSHAKELALRSLAQQVADGSLDLAGLSSLPDDQVLGALTSVVGIGDWTAGVFMMFRLGRQDVLLAGDLGIRKAAQVAYGLDGLPGIKALEVLGEPWRPYRTRACLYLWDSLPKEAVSAAAR
jgi:DNA-3-methyladenine glycosylase II